MLLKLSDKISQCVAHAADARERANAATDPSRRADLLDMELRWLRLVESYRFVPQVPSYQDLKWPGELVALVRDDAIHVGFWPIADIVLTGPVIKNVQPGTPPPR